MEGKVFFRGAIFSEAKFSEVRFSPVKFNVVTFEKAKFLGKTVFDDSTFSGSATFKNSVFSPAFSNILLIYGKMGTILLLNIISVGISFTLLPLTLFMGLTGLALMRGITIASSFLITLHFISKNIRVRVELESLAKTLISAATMAAITLTLQQTLQSNIFLPLYAAVVASVYITLVRELKILKREDADLISNIAGRRLSKHIVKMLNINPKTQK
ncbi:MAG: polysaccharide biosynthesis C-terminal domain-containing protein [Thermoproteota archaeon]